MQLLPGLQSENMDVVGPTGILEYPEALLRSQNPGPSRQPVGLGWLGPEQEAGSALLAVLDGESEADWNRASGLRGMGLQASMCQCC